MFGLGTGELIVILLILVLLFGASRLPALGKALGQGMRDFKHSLSGTEETEEEKDLKKDPSSE